MLEKEVLECFDWMKHRSDAAIIAFCETAIDHILELAEAFKNGGEMKALFRKYLAMRVRRCVLGPALEHPRRQMARDLAPGIASFLV